MSTPIGPFSIRVRAKPDGLWTLADEFAVGSCVLKISAKPRATWAYADAAAARCGAEGHRNSLLSREKCLLASAPVGALIGKIGGSTADTEGTKFVVGRYCVVRVPAEGGPLFLTINDEYGGMDNNADSIDVDVSEITLPPAPAPAPAPAAPCALMAALAKLAGTCDAKAVPPGPATVSGPGGTQ